MQSRAIGAFVFMLQASAVATALPASAADDEAAAVESSCTQNNFLSTYASCSCVAAKLRAARANGDAAARDELTARAANECPQERSVVTSRTLRNCEQVFERTRADHAELCKCTAEKFAAAYAANHLVNLRHIEKLRADAMSACGVGRPSPMVASQPAPAVKAAAPAPPAASCFTTKTDREVLGDGQVSRLRLKNGCADTVTLLAELPGTGQCLPTELAQGVTIGVASADKHAKICRVPAMPDSMLGSCSCPPGVESVPIPNPSE